MENTEGQADVEALQKALALLEEQKSELINRVRDLSLRDREKNNLIRTLFDNLPYGVVMFDDDRNVVQINQAAADIFGFDKRELIGRNCAEIINCYERNMGCPVLDGEQVRNQERTSCVGCGKTLLRSAVKNKLSDGMVIVESFGDISELEQATIEKTLALQTKSNFLSNISHELRTPIHGILGFTELLKRDEKITSEHSHSNIEQLDISGKRLWKLLEKLFQAASLEENNLQPDITSFDFDMFMADFETEVRLFFSETSNTLKFDIESSIGYVMTDELKLNQILMGLFENAVKYTESGLIECCLRLELRDEKKWLLFQIKDNGVGIAEEKQSDIFDLFEQEDGSGTRAHQGAGLGLAIVKQLAVLMGGDISLQSKPGQGSVFSLNIPV